jgi:type III restriction enzyme
MCQNGHKPYYPTLILSAIEKAKIECAEKLFNTIFTTNVKYHKVATYQDLIEGMNAVG